MVSLATLAPVAAARPAADASVRAALDGYACLARRAYAESLGGAESLQMAVQAMLARPSERALAQARDAWVACRDGYGRTEVFRFSGGPIDDRHPITGIEGPENRINAWPIDEAFLDYVAGSPRAGLIGDLRTPLSEAVLVSRNVADDENQVTLGYHAIEFLLWGQDRRRDGPGQRPFTDYLPGDPVRERRRRCLSLITDQLVRDLASVKIQWEAGPKHFVDYFRALDPAVALGHALSGPATLAAFELASERISVPLSSGSQEDEESCFSDNTLRDLAANVEGIAQVLEGDAECPGLLNGDRGDRPGPGRRRRGPPRARPRARVRSPAAVRCDPVRAGGRPAAPRSAVAGRRAARLGGRAPARGRRVRRAGRHRRRRVMRRAAFLLVAYALAALAMQAARLAASPGTDWMTDPRSGGEATTDVQTRSGVLPACARPDHRAALGVRVREPDLQHVVGGGAGLGGDVRRARPVLQQPLVLGLPPARRPRPAAGWAGGSHPLDDHAARPGRRSRQRRGPTASTGASSASERSRASRPRGGSRCAGAGARTGIRTGRTPSCARRASRSRIGATVRSSRDTRLSARIAPAVIGVGLLELVPDSTLLALADPDDRDGDGISGRIHWIARADATTRRAGRFGWKATQPTVADQVTNALANDIGITTPAHPELELSANQRAAAARPSGGEPELDGRPLASLIAYCRMLAVPARRDPEGASVMRGANRFVEVGCAGCHTPTLTTGESGVGALSRQTIHPYTDLLLHDMGPELSDGMPERSAAAAEWRTPPLWGLGLARRVGGFRFLLHDGRAGSLEEAILWHDGEAKHSRDAFRALPATGRNDLLRFLESL